MIAPETQRLCGGYEGTHEGVRGIIPVLSLHQGEIGGARSNYGHREASRRAAKDRGGATLTRAQTAPSQSWSKSASHICRGFFKALP